MARLLDRYRNEVLPTLKAELGRDNNLAVPRLDKIVVSMGVGKALQDKKHLDNAARDLSSITGQRPLACKARKSVSNFKVRAGTDTGLKVTLRRHRMYEFLERLIALAIPRVRDFRGLDPRSFDGRGNYSLGLSEQTVFPEVDPDKVEAQQGMNITIVTTAQNDTESRRLLQLMGMPFRS
jgi:large subunit ribosomal protein L5